VKELIEWLKAHKAWRIATIALVIVLAIGAVGVGAYTLFNGSAQVTVIEGITWNNFSGDGGFNYETGQWSVSMYPGETKSMQLGLYNAGSVAIDVTVVADSPTLTFDGATTYTVPAHSGVWANFSVTASVSIVPNVYTIPLSITR
jgi:hypothetical protein